MGGDCDDADNTAYPRATEVADWIEHDCDGTVDEGTTAYDDDGDGYTEIGGDCDDADNTAYPRATEVADWIEHDCDGTVDEGTTAYDDDGDGYT
ncbi:MAG: MopE-related protein, partial [bacterium]